VQKSRAARLFCLHARLAVPQFQYVRLIYRPHPLPQNRLVNSAFPSRAATDGMPPNGTEDAMSAQITMIVLPLAAGAVWWLTLACVSSANEMSTTQTVADLHRTAS
jgi:hypothetical protein